MDGGIKVEFNIDGGFYMELGGWWSKWIKRFINQQVNHQIVASAQQPSHQPNAMKFFFFSFCSLSFFFTQMSWRQGTKRAELITALLPRSASLNSVWLPNELTKNPIHHP